MKTLLAIINDPADSAPFLKYVIQMAGDLHLNLHLLYIQDPQAYPIGTTGATGAAAIQFERNLEKEREDTLDSLKEQVDILLQELTLQMKVDFSSETGSRNMIAEKYVKEGKCNMLVLEGKEEANFWSLHATNMDIVLQVECPVWIIPKPSNYKAFKKIIYATDYNEEDVDTLKNLIELTHKYSPKIIALHVLKSSDFHARVMSSGFQEMIEDQTEYDDIAVKTMKEESEGDIGKTVNHFSVKENADLLVILKENRGFFERIFKPSLTNRILSETELPVLVFHEKG
jgi:nucleotide-binding universal stress UspA family protein